MAIEVRGLAPLLQVFDMPTSVRFYCEALGFELVSTSAPGEPHFDWALLRLQGIELMLNTAYERDARPPAPEPTRISAHDDTCLFFGCPDVDHAYQELTGKGVAAEPPKTAPYGMRQLYLKDPDGYGICLQWPA